MSEPYMTLAEKDLIRKAMAWLEGKPTETKDIAEVESYITVFCIERSIDPTNTPHLKMSLRDALYPDPVRRVEAPHPRDNNEQLKARTKCCQTVKKILETWGFPSCDLSFSSMLDEVYSHPDCVAYYRNKEGVWLMTMILQQAIGHYVAERKDRIFDSCMLYNLNNMKPAVEAAAKQQEF